MATVYFTGNQRARAWSNTCTVTAAAAGGTITATVNSKADAYTVTAADTTTALAAAGAMSQWQTSLVRELADFTFTLSGSVVTATGPSDGRPVAVTFAASGGTTTVTSGTPVAATSPNDFQLSAGLSCRGRCLSEFTDHEPLRLHVPEAAMRHFTLQGRTIQGVSDTSKRLAKHNEFKAAQTTADFILAIKLATHWWISDLEFDYAVMGNFDMAAKVSYHQLPYDYAFYAGEAQFKKYSEILEASFLEDKDGDPTSSDTLKALCMRWGYHNLEGTLDDAVLDALFHKNEQTPFCLQGRGGNAYEGHLDAAMTALSLAFIHDIVPASATGRAMGLLGTMSAIGTTLGPSLGGMLAARFGWETIFLINVPIGLAAMLIGFRHLPAHPSAADQQPLFDSGMLRARPVTAGLAANALVSTVMMTTLVVGPFHLSRSLELSDGAMGLALSIGPLVAALTGIPAGRLIDRYGAERMTITGLIGLATTASILGVLPVGAGTSGYLVAVGGMTAAYAVFQAANNTHLMTSIDSRARVVAAGMLGLTRNLGLIAGASAMGAVFAWGVGPTGVVDAPPDAVAAGVRITFRIAALLIGVAIAAVMSSRAVLRTTLNHSPVVTSHSPSPSSPQQPCSPPTRRHHRRVPRGGGVCASKRATMWLASSRLKAAGARPREMTSSS